MWRESLRLAVALGLSPADFWALSWREWRWLNATPAPPNMPRTCLDDLMSTYPDAPK